MSRECSDVLGAMALSRADNVRRDSERTVAGVVAVILPVALRVAAPSRTAFSTTSHRPRAGRQVEVTRHLQAAKHSETIRDYADGGARLCLEDDGLPQPQTPKAGSSHFQITYDIATTFKMRMRHSEWESTLLHPYLQPARRPGLERRLDEE